MDTRLVGINAGFPHRNPEIFADTLPGTFNDPRPKLYLLNPEDHTSLDILRKQYPDATYRVRASQIPGRSFGIFTVAGEKAP